MRGLTARSLAASIPSVFSWVAHRAACPWGIFRPRLHLLSQGHGWTDGGRGYWNSRNWWFAFFKKVAYGGLRQKKDVSESYRCVFFFSKKIPLKQTAGAGSSE